MYLILQYGSPSDASSQEYKRGMSCHQEYSYEGNPSASNNNVSNLDGTAESTCELRRWWWWWISYIRVRWIWIKIRYCGICYGDSQLNIIYLGGWTFGFNGTNGGATIIECKPQISIQNMY